MVRRHLHTYISLDSIEYTTIESHSTMWPLYLLWYPRSKQSMIDDLPHADETHDDDDVDDDYVPLCDVGCFLSVAVETGTLGYAVDGSGALAAQPFQRSHEH